MEETRKYKQTELGLLPEDWEVARLGDIGYFLKGNGISKSQANSGDLCAVRYGELYTLHHNYIKTYNSHISKEVALFATKIQKGDILFACSGETKEEIGKCAAFVDEVEAYAGGDILILRTDQEKCSDIFLGFLLNMPIAANQKAAKGQGDAVVHISKASLENLSIPLPPIEEQRRIASALTSIDNLIDSLDRLIAKKRDIKQGAMQQLLSGKKRLKGFTEPWIEKKLGADALILRGGSPRPIEDYITENTDGLNWIKIGDVKPNDKYIRKTAEKIIKEGLAKTRQVKKGDFILSNSMSFGRPYILDIDGCIHDGWLVIQDYQEAYEMQFLYYILCSDVIMNQYVSMAAGSGVQNLNKDKVADVLLYAPSSLTEQQAIASVLTSMDNELSALEAKRKKYEQIKQGMMQQLLTGRIRLN